MNILFDIGHPAHVHLFKNFIQYLKAQNHDITIVSREKDITNILLDHLGFSYVSLSRPRKTKIGMFVELIERDLKIFRLHRIKNFDIAFGTSVSIGHLTLLKKVPSYNFNEDDDETVPLFVKVSYPFNTAVINPDTIRAKKYLEKRIYHDSYHELAYLHPNNFKPDDSVLIKYGLYSNKYIIIRKSALSAHHDDNAKGLNSDVWEKVIELCNQFQVILSFEGRTTHEIEPWDMHHILYYAKMLITDGLSMSIEASVLGTPSIRYNSFEGKSTVLEDCDAYGLSVGFNANSEESRILFISKIKSLIDDKSQIKDVKEKNCKLLHDKKDLNLWMIDLFEKTQSP